MQRKVCFISNRNLVLALGPSFVLPASLCLCTVEIAYVVTVSMLGMEPKVLCMLGQLSVSQAL